MISTFTISNLLKIGSPNLKENKAIIYFDSLLAAMDQFEINTVERISAFLGQILHETRCFSLIEENLNYSAKGLRETFPKRFPTIEIAGQYQRKPEAIANRAYANKIGNGDESSGDGYKYRGRGLIQTTGKGNYFNLSKAINIDCLNTPDLLLQPKYACLSAAYFFQSNGLNELADKGSFETLTAKVNAAKLGLEERKKYYQKALVVLKG